MDQFWKWLLRANARNLFIGALLALIGVTGWWVWREVTYEETTLRASGSMATNDVGRRLGILDSIEAQLSDESSVAVDRNPFVPPGQAAPPWVPVPAVGAEARPPEVVKPPAPPPKAAPAILTYRGMFRPPDGKALAFIEDSRNKRTALYREGDRLFGATVASIGMTSAVLRAGADALIELPFGRPCSVEEQDHARP